MNEKEKLRRLPKRILSFVLTFVMVLGMLPSMAMAAEANWDDECFVGDILYNLDTTTNTAALVEIQDDTLTELNVSTVEYEGVVYTVTDALDGVACGAPLLTSINLPNVTTLDGATFAFLENLTSVSLPKVITVGILAFSECPSLESIDLPEATSIAQSAFEDCTALESVSLPKVTSIGIMAFNLTALATLDLPEVTSVGNGAFANNASLASVSFPKVITIGNDAFKNCESLSSITIPACTTSVGTRAFQGCDSLTSVVVTSKDTSIDAAAFTGVGKSGTTASLTLPSDWPENDRPDASGNWKGGKFGTVTYTGGTGSTISPVTFTATGDVTVSLAKMPSGASYEYSSDGGENWTAFTAAVAMTNGDSIAVRMNKDVKAANVTYSGSYYLQFKTEGEGTLTVSGDVMSLLAADAVDMPEYAYSNLFDGMTQLVDASELELPATTLTYSCYYSMFKGCTALTAAPELPATTLAGACYSYMFNGCTALTAAPELPATKMADSCYSHMFNGCTELTEAPELPATELVQNCYNSMFMGCTALTTAPSKLPAEALAKGCYDKMFNGCEKLTTAPDLPATNLKQSCYRSMFDGCKALTAAPALPATNLEQSCYQAMFGGCKALTAAPELPATTLVRSCYQGMFNNCTSLTSVPALPATTMVMQCYKQMFDGCSALTELTASVTDFSGTDVITNWLKGTAADTTGTLYVDYTLLKDKDAEALAALKASLKLPENWELALNPEPLTFTATGEVSLYLGRNITNAKFERSIDGGKTWNEFKSSVKLADGESVMIRMDQTVAADAVTHNSKEYFAFKASGTGTLAVSGNIMSMLPKGTKNLPGDYTFYAAFSGMKNLTDASELLLPATELSDYCYMNMFNGCKALIKGPKLPATKMKPSCYYGMFDGCESLTEAPELPATELAGSCYSNMFQGCKALTKAPALPATKMETYCYSKLFNNCAALTEAPALPATELAASCYYFMFGGCKALTKAPALPATEMANYCYQVMFYNCAELETAPTLPATTLAEGCYLAMFQGCKALTKAPALPATELEKNCYKSMFYGCTGLTKAPALPATELAESCYGSMFNSCTALTRATVAATSFSAESCITDWLKNIETTGVLYVPDELLKDKTENEINTLKTDLGLPETWELKSIEADMLDLLDLLAGMTLTQQEVTPAFTLSVGETEEDSIPTLKFTGTPANENEFPFTFVSIEKDNDGKFIITGSNGNSSEGSVITISFDEETGVITAKVEGFPDGSPEQPNFTPLNGTYKSAGYVKELDIENEDGDALVTITLPVETFMTADFGNEGDEGYIATYRQYDVDALDFDYYAWELDETDTDLATAVANELEDYEGVEATKIAIDGLAVYYYDAEDEGYTTRTYLFQVDGKIHELVFFMTDAENELETVEKIMTTLQFTGAKAPDTALKDDEGVVVPGAGAVEDISPIIKDNDFTVALKTEGLADAIYRVDDDTTGLWVWLEVTEQDEDPKYNADKAIINEALGNKTVGAYLDIKLLQQAINEAESAPAQLADGQSVTIALTVPESLRAPAGKVRSFVILHTHEGAAAETITPESYDSKTGTLTFKADKFSTYALVYTETNAYTGGGSSSNAITAPAAVKHGTVTVDKKSASSGETVTITVSPDKGYTLETLTVKTANGKEVELTKVNDTTYTFKMPSGKVTVEATFMEDNSMLNFFVDVYANDYYYDAVLWAAENGITKGISATTFGPAGITTRAQVVTFLWRAAGCPEPKAMSSFSDVESGSYYEKAVAWAVENGITKGTSATTFSPDAECTRSQIVTFLYRFNGVDTMNIKDNPFTDVAEGEFYYDAVLWAAENGVTSGTSATTFSPASNCLRGQVVTFLYRLLVK